MNEFEKFHQTHSNVHLVFVGGILDKASCTTPAVFHVFADLQALGDTLQELSKHNAESSRASSASSEGDTERQSLGGEQKRRTGVHYLPALDVPDIWTAVMQASAMVNCSVSEGMSGCASALVSAGLWWALLGCAGPFWKPCCSALR